MKAIIDLGTNTFNLLVYTTGDEGPRMVHSSELPVFLGRGGIEQGLITEEAMERGMAALRQHRDTALGHGATWIAGFGTSALRNARNAAMFTQRAQDELGIPIRIIAGDEEAGLILAGVRQAVSFGTRPVLVMDIGGGSIEFILATHDALMWKRSFELGVTRLRERIPLSDPPALDEEARVAAHLDDRLGPLYAVIERHEPHLLIGSAGSFDSLARILSDEVGEPLRPEMCAWRFEAAAFEELKDRLMRMPRDQRLRVPGLPEHRVDTMAYALIAIERVLLAGGIRALCWSRYALKEGVAAGATGA